MALSGYAPAALSPESMSASARCLTTSEMSATCTITLALTTLQWLLLNSSMSLYIQAQYRRMCIRGDLFIGRIKGLQGAAHLSAGGRGVLNHRLEEVGGDDDRLAGLSASHNNLLLH